MDVDGPTGTNRTSPRIADKPSKQQLQATSSQIEAVIRLNEQNRMPYRKIAEQLSISLKTVRKYA